VAAVEIDDADSGSGDGNRLGRGYGGTDDEETEKIPQVIKTLQGSVRLQLFAAIMDSNGSEGQNQAASAVPG